MTDFTVTAPTDVLKAALLCVSTETARPYICGVYLDPAGFVVATNGHVMFCAQIDMAVPAPGWLIPSDAVKRALGVKAVTLEVSASCIGDVTYAQSEGLVFPDWRRVIPRAEGLSGEAAQFNPDYIGLMGKIAKLLGAGSAAVHHNGEGPSLVTFGGHDDAFACVMPLRVPDLAKQLAENTALAAL